MRFERYGKILPTVSFRKTHAPQYYGKITPQIARQHISATEMSGDNHVVWYDLTNGVMWAAFAAPHGAGGPTQAYWRQYVEIDSVSAFAEAPPS